MAEMERLEEKTANDRRKETKFDFFGFRVKTLGEKKQSLVLVWVNGVRRGGNSKFEFFCFRFLAGTEILDF